jgi:streptogramin lyase
VAIAAVGGRIWVTEDVKTGPCVVLRIDPATNRTTGPPIPVGDNPDSIVPGAGALWVTSGVGGSVDRIDPATGVVTATLSILNVDAVGAGSLWGTTGYGVQRIDPSTGAPTATITRPGAQYVVFWAGSAWAVTGTPSGGLVRIDPATNRVSGLAFRFGNDLTYAAPGPGGLWVNDYSTGELLRLAFAS